MNLPTVFASIPGYAGLAALALATALSATPAPARAADVVIYRAGERVDPAAVARILGNPPSLQRPAGVRARSVQLLDDVPPRPGAAINAGQMLASVGPIGEPVNSRPSAQAPTSLSLPVPFAFDSSDLLPDARLQLDAVAQGIQMLPASHRIVIEGHTDATGADDYNRVLSERRAQAVRQYLVTMHGIASQRLATVGFGKAAPLDQTRPEAGINRRVQFRSG